MPIWLENGPLRASFCLGPRRCGSHGPIFTPLARTFFARQLVQEENRGHLYHFGNLGVLSSVFIRDLDGITVQWRSEGQGKIPGRRARGRIFGAKDNWRNLKFRPSQDLKNGPPISICLYGLKMGPLGPLFAWAPAAAVPTGPYLRHWQGLFLLVNLFKRKIWAICTIWGI